VSLSISHGQLKAWKASEHQKDRENIQEILWARESKHIGEVFLLGSTGAIKKDATENGEPAAEMPDVADSDQEDFEDIENVEDAQDEVAGSTPEEQDSAMQDAANLAEFDGEIEVWMGDVSEAGTQQNPIPTNTPHSSDGPEDLPIQPQGPTIDTLG
jgi:hypothetical protein